jgi:adenylate kinase
MKIVMLGPQASGKGTQASMLADHLDVPHISTGEILRQNIKKKTKLGQQVQSMISKGELVPDDIMNRLVADRLGEEDCAQGFILDGYPRTLAQARALDMVVKLDKAIEISISDDEAVKRISGRRTCEKCGEVYSIYQQGMDFNNVCKKCGGNLIIRGDDREEVVLRRLSKYHEETEPLVEFYKQKGSLLKINGERPIQDIAKEIIKRIK